MKKNVLVIGMLDSIHLSRWLEQFNNDDINFYLFPSKKYRKLNQNLIRIAVNSTKAQYVHHGNLGKYKYSGYVDFIKFEILKFGSLRRKSLEKLLKNKSFDYIHAIEIQGAGYLLGSVEKIHWKKAKTILTNWGSDIFYFSRFDEHRSLIGRILQKVDFYSAECQRDYELAANLHFEGTFLPCIPNAGGFNVEESRIDYIDPDKRRQIIIKGYGGVFGRSDIPISLIENINSEFPDFNFYLYSVTPDALKLIEKLPRHILKQIRISKSKDRLTQKDIMKEFSKSRLYIGCSESDGISTSFLEALVTGAYPIQTNTSCANEWILKGAIGSLVNLDSQEILNEIRVALRDDDLVNNASLINYQVSRKYLTKSEIEKIASEFYR